MRFLSSRYLLLVMALLGLTQTLNIPPDGHTHTLVLRSHETIQGQFAGMKGHIVPGMKKTGSKKTGSKKTGSKKTGSKKTGSKKTGVKTMKSHRSSSATSTLSGYCPVQTTKSSKHSKAPNASKKHVGRSKTRRNPGFKSGSKSGKQLQSKADDICNWRPASRPVTGNTCDYLVSCEVGNEPDSIGPDTYTKSSKSSKDSKSTKPSKHRASKASRHSERQLFSIDFGHLDGLVARGEPRRYRTDVEGASKLVIYSLDYPSNSDLYEDEGATLKPVALSWQKADDLNNFAVKDMKKVPSDMPDYVTEHLIELQTVKMFIEEQVKSSTTDGIWFEEWWNKELDETKVKNRKSKALEYGSKRELPLQKTLNDLIFQALGSMDNRADFVLCNSEINTYKMRLWLEHNFIAPRKFNRLLEELKRGGEHSNKVIGVFHKVLGVYSYMNHNEVKPRLNNIFENVRRELSNIEELTGENENLDLKWTIWMTGRLKEIDEKGKEWLNMRIEAAKKAYDFSIKEIEEAEKARMATPKKVLRSAKERFKVEIEALDAQRKLIEKNIENTKKARKDLQTAAYKAIGSRDSAAIEKADEDLTANETRLRRLKDDRRENEWDRNAKIREGEMELLGTEKYGIVRIKAELQEGQKTLLAFEKKINDLSMPTLGSQLTIPIRPGGT